MTALIIIGVILLILLLLLLVPVSLRLDYRQGSFRLRLCYLFLRFDLSPEKIAKVTEGDAEKETKKEVKKKSKETPSGKDKSKGALDTAATVWSMIKSSGKGLNRIRRHLIFYKVRVRGAVGREDAHQTAVFYGRISALVAVLLSVIGELFVLKTPRVHVFPDFTKDKCSWDIHARVRIQPIVLLSAALTILLGIWKVIRKDKAERVRKKGKGGQVHESATSH